MATTLSNVPSGLLPPTVTAPIFSKTSEVSKTSSAWCGKGKMCFRSPSRTEGQRRMVSAAPCPRRRGWKTPRSRSSSLCPGPKRSSRVSFSPAVGKWSVAPSALKGSRNG